MKSERWKKRKEAVQESWLLYLLAFSIPVLLFIWMMKDGGFYPFGDKTLFIMDMNNGVMQNYYNARRIYSGEESFLFNWSVSMGRNYIGLFSFAAISPLTIFTTFFSMEKFTKGIMALLAAGMGFSGLTFSMFGKHLWKRHAEQKKDCFKGKLSCLRFLPVLIPSIGYALLSYNIVYTVMPTWTTGVIMLPLVLLGFEKILDGEKGLFAVISMAVLFVCNYYMAFMVGIFTGLYLIYRFVSLLEKGKIKELFFKIIRFALCAALAFGLAAPLLLPIGQELLYGKLATNGYRPEAATNYEKYTDFLGKLTNGKYDTITNGGLPSIYCGYCVVVLALLFFVIIKKIKWREKIGALLILFIVSYSFWNVQLDIYWHAFHYPNWFPFRYAYVFTFMLCYMAVRALCALVPSAQNLLEKQLQLSGRKPVIAVLAVIVILIFDISVDMKSNGQILLDGLGGQFGYKTQAEYLDYVNKTKPLVSEIQENDESFYRISQLYEYSKNDALLLGYRGMTHYSANYNVNVNNLTRALGHAQTWYWNSGVGATPLTDSLFDVKYILQDNQFQTPYTMLRQDAAVSSYQNENALSIAYASSVANLSPALDNLNTFVNENVYLQTIMGNDKVYFHDLEYTLMQTDNTYTAAFTAQDSNPVYLKIAAGSIAGGQVNVNGVLAGYCLGTDTACNIYLGSFSAGQTVTVDIIPNEAITLSGLFIDSLDMEELKAAVETLRKNQMEIDKVSGHGLSGTIHVDDGQTIITSIPYEEGWTVKVDGKKASLEPFAGTFIAVTGVDAGEHEITFEFLPPGFKQGLILSFVTVALLGILIWFEKKGKFLRKKTER